MRRKEMAGWLHPTRILTIWGGLRMSFLPRLFLLFHWLSRFISFTWVVKKEGCLMQHQDSLRQFSSFGSNTLSPLALFLGSTCLLCASVILTKTFYGKLQQSLTGFTGSHVLFPEWYSSKNVKRMLDNTLEASEQWRKLTNAKFLRLGAEELSGRTMLNIHLYYYKW